MTQPIAFFENAKDIGIRLFRSAPSCNCGCCINELRLGIIPTTDEDVMRLFKEQEKYNIVFTIEPPEYIGTIFKMTKPKLNTKANRKKALIENQKKLEKLLLK